MLQIDDKIISFDVLDKKFVCDITKCKGACCIEGDAGAPLEKKELKILEKVYPSVKPYLRKISIETIEKQGVYVIDSDGDYVTPLIENRECAYLIFENDIALCGIEKAYLDKKIKFRKPVSCHLYPIRITKYKQFDAVNYEENKICKHALINGEQKKEKLYLFLEEPLTRTYGKKWVEKLKIAASELLKNSST
ncbi:MAG TPA: DUF3109 domain-containing protein [Bacteroidales bacterium]|nr:MAG: hypothetical protein A2W98_06905 [Bacteroidetes bacterium GWF2_33_38]OFY76171.1 MAG: hypothetical protein A2265_09575 [Bacteroidetes bacterium RIFOXYA12_FULL_33_9]OFY90546.1 MAG: hypothetical protein A2236_05675 [Bacteroidetes bacterium RIFOXYA2_FULL_33_7]HBF88105.1 DUF3109 domain-containing protein [Bacteroidales bacterium]